MADAQRLRDRVRDGAMRLDGHHRVAGRAILRVPRDVMTLRSRIIHVCHQLVERFHAHAARVAVLEEQYGARFGFGDQTVELVEVLDCCQLRMHLNPV